MMPKIDLSGFGGVAVTAGSSGSAARMFAGNAAADKVTTDATAETGIVFPRSASWTNATSAASMFAGCSALASAEVTDLCQNKGGVNLYGLFEGCESLASATLSASTQVATASAADAAAAQARIGTASNMVAMFRGCKALTDVDLSGVGTYGLPGTIDLYGTANDPESGMSRMFEGCDSLLFENDPGTERGRLMQAMEAAKASENAEELDEAREKYEEKYAFGRVTIGPAFTKVMNGFFAWREVADRRPHYVIAADVYVYGGPTAIGGRSVSEASDLMARPSVGGYNYFGEVLLADGAALERNDAGTPEGSPVKGIWTIQDYFSTPTPAVTVTFKADWADAQASPASQSRAFRSAKYRFNEDDEIYSVREGEALSRSGVAAPSGLGYAAAAADGTVAGSADDVAWRLAKDVDFTYYDKDGDPHEFHGKKGDLAVTVEEFGAAADKTGLCALFGQTFFGPMPARKREDPHPRGGRQGPDLRADGPDRARMRPGAHSL